MWPNPQLQKPSDTRNPGLPFTENSRSTYVSFENKKTKSMFPLNQKDNQMNKRHSEKYKVQHANTARLQKFSIIYMQNMLNDHEEKHGS